ncbi:MAG: pantoate--beta-alanine ligase [Chloroflexi bacterium]|nr:pantoate--beta-alanine ligase [Chloroflexota bacterium]
MKVVKTVQEFRDQRKNLSNPLGFVPTMGFLHEGHLSLVRAAHRECRSVAVSIFVNPTQFGPNEDFEAYPRDMDADLEKLEGEQVDIVLTPDKDDLYPAGFQTWVEVESLTQPLEGIVRPGHFRGVTTVVAKFFNIVQPDRAYFGQKDAQQAAVLRRMAADLNFPLEVITCPTLREPDGLAMSSRNTYLNPEQRKAAAVLYRSLNEARLAFEKGEKNANSLRQLVKNIIAGEPLARLDYVSCADLVTLQELDKIERQALLSMAVFIGKTRLIDNVILG